ncbi:hypothetical protein FOA52_004967 [Chlamydomonas sp. UWO 241]|nr:hypothetical protein FOA52_004967 [Chlamydomonas sp. UWO 241]
MASMVRPAAVGVQSPRMRQRPVCARAAGSQHAGFSDASLDTVRVSIIGDLHLAPDQMHLFNSARSHLIKAMSSPDGKLLPGARVVQLGDLGHGKHGSGGVKCFELARDFIKGFGAPAALVLGNHADRGQMITIVSAYSPTEAASDEEAGDFYLRVAALADKANDKRDLLIVAGGSQRHAWDSSQLRRPAVRREFNPQLSDRFGLLEAVPPEGADAQAEYDAMAAAIREVATNHLAPRGSHRRRGWQFTLPQRTLRLMDARQRAHSAWLRSKSAAAKRKRNRANRAADAAVQRDRERWIGQQVAEAQDMLRKKNLSQSARACARLAGSSRSHQIPPAMRDVSGALHSGPDGVLKAMTESFDKLYGRETKLRDETLNQLENDVAVFELTRATEVDEAHGRPPDLAEMEAYLEGAEFEDDAENLAAWHGVFGQQHYWSADLGHAVAIGLSTVRHRSNAFSHHEVYIDDEQVAWLEQTLTEHKDRPVVVFTHAPPIGCGLRVIQNVHVKNRCAWLCHSDRPERFIQMVEAHPNVKLWFSGHFHLSHNYPDSISVVGGTAFIQTGVIGECNRDGQRHSRFLSVTKDGYEVHTVDHDTGEMRPDLESGWGPRDVPVPIPLSEDELLCDPSAGWLCSKIDGQADTECDFTDNDFIKWLPVGSKSILALQDDMLVEYDVALRSPVGVVTKVPDGSRVLLWDSAEQLSTSPDGSDVHAVVVTNVNKVPEVFTRNAQGGFWRTYQPNKWRIKKAKEAAEREEAAAAAAAAAAAS